ncbi:MAG: hypothetical protein K2X11_22415 [Acetobacteraceae bacterium]|nr:hypothetical protein [Acetobacteraceae bacterium]
MESLRQVQQVLTIPGLPDWTGLVLLLILLLLGACLLLMPFSVFGVKGRLDAIEAQLDEMRAEIRALGARMGEGRVRNLTPVETDFDMPAPPEAEEAPVRRGHPDIPNIRRAEPRITWPRR